MTGSCGRSRMPKTRKACLKCLSVMLDSLDGVGIARRWKNVGRILVVGDTAFLLGSDLTSFAQGMQGSVIQWDIADLARLPVAPCPSCCRSRPEPGVGKPIRGMPYEIRSGGINSFRCPAGRSSHSRHRHGAGTRRDLGPHFLHPRLHRRKRRRSRRSAWRVPVPCRCRSMPERAFAPCGWWREMGTAARNGIEPGAFRVAIHWRPGGEGMAGYAG